MVRLCSDVVTALAVPPAEEHPPSAAASAAHPRTPRHASLVLPHRSATLRQNTVFFRSASSPRLRAPLRRCLPSSLVPRSSVQASAGALWLAVVRLRRHPPAPPHPV